MQARRELPKCFYQCLRGWAEQAELQGDSVKWKTPRNSRSGQQMYYCLLTNNKPWFWVRVLKLKPMQHMTCLFTQANPEGIALKIYFTLFNLRSRKCITDSCYLSIHTLLLFKLVWEQRQLYLNNLSSRQYLLRLINISKEVTIDPVVYWLLLRREKRN